MKIVLLLVGLAGLAYAQGDGKDYCDEIHFKSCQVNLGAYWKANEEAIFETPYLFAETVNQQLIPPYGINNMVKVCNGLSLFYQCLTRRNAGLCLGPIGWLARGHTPLGAYAFDGMLNSLLFQCGVGFLSITHNNETASCLQQVTVNFDPEISKFYRSYELNIEHDSANACYYAQQLVDGVSAIYASVSGPCAKHTGHARWFACEMTRRYTFAQFSHCQHQLTCAKPTDTVDLSHLVKMSEGKAKFLLPATWRKDAQGKWSLEEAKWI